jgi:hypothetical protein
VSGGASAWGIRSLADTFFRYFQPGLVCFLRFQNVLPNPEGTTDSYTELGFMPAVTGGQGGFYDLQIDPPADVQEVSLHNIGIMGGKLMFGARTFIISHTFVINEMRRRELDDPYMVWRDPAVMGLFYNGRLFSIESLTHEEVGSETTLWKLVCNSSEISSPSS